MEANRVVVVNKQVADWRYSLYGCFDNIGLCCLAFWVPCIVEAEIAEYFGENKLEICLWIACVGCNFMPTLRAKYRQEYNIPGSLVGDYMYGLCCHCCLLIQLQREIRDRRPQHNVQSVTTVTQIDRA